jgi:hypothetical protein
MKQRFSAIDLGAEVMLESREQREIRERGRD